MAVSKSIVGRLLVKLGADSTELDSKFEQTQKKIGTFAKKAKARLKKIGVAFKEFSKIAVAAFAAVVAGAVGLADTLGETIVKLQNFAKANGTTVAQVQKLQYAMKSISAEGEATDIIRDMGDHLGDAAANGGSLEKMLNSVGLSAKKLVQEGPVKQLEDIGKAISGLPKAQQVNILESIASNLSDLGPLLTNNAKGLKEASAAAEKFGGVTSKDLNDALARTNQALLPIKTMFLNIAAQLLARTAPAFEKVRDIMGSNGFQKVLHGVFDIMDKITSAVLPVVEKNFTIIGQILSTGVMKKGLKLLVELLTGTLIAAEKLIQGGLIVLRDILQGISALINTGPVKKALSDMKTRFEQIASVVKGAATEVAKLYGKVKDFFEYLAGKKHQTAIEKLQARVDSLRSTINALESSQGARQFPKKIQQQKDLLNVLEGQLAIQKAKAKAKAKADSSIAPAGKPGKTVKVKGKAPANLPTVTTTSKSHPKTVKIPAQIEIKSYAGIDKDKLDSLTKSLTQYASVKDKIAALNEEYQTNIDLINRAADRSQITGQERDKMLDELKTRYQKNTDAFKSSVFGMSEFAKMAKDNIQSALGDTLHETLTGNFKGILGSWAGMVEKMGEQAVAAKLNEKLFGGGGDSSGSAGGSGGLIGSLMSKFSGQTSGGFMSDAGSLLGKIGGMFGGFFASGGNPPVNKASVVGERGPELFVPRQAGTVVPNNAFSGGGSSCGGTQVNIINQNGSQVQQTKRRGPNGQDIIDIQIKNAMHRMVQSGDMDEVMRPYAFGRQQAVT
ncbi:hypothetical protein [Salinisphaera sp. LB1]|uniref:hypothetical protein n=1 Tax=Salinisphaera sp. LB1 TaxID=2183911 RepID=UPI000D706893|nr:hypothetical protein [Salinisphaera sp. LB1]AWN17675.1 Phage protein [Salinisphaera sp. LB1]